MTQAKTNPRLEYPKEVLDKLYKRYSSDSGAKADFKRALTGEIKHLQAVYPHVLYLLQSIHPLEQQRIWLPVVCLRMTFDNDDQDDHCNFGLSCLRLKNKLMSEGTERRFRALLDTTLVDFQFPLTALIRQMKSKNVNVNYALLIADLRQWEHPDLFIQDRWARTFWGADESKPSNQNDEPFLQGDES